MAVNPQQVPVRMLTASAVPELVLSSQTGVRELSPKAHHDGFEPYSLFQLAMDRSKAGCF
jgi:hypothetical protein